jgi:hypothetical protein
MSSAEYEFGGVIPADAPDPMIERWAKVARMPFRVFGLVRQRSLEEFGPSSIDRSSDEAGVREMSVGITYTVIRHPEDRANPANLAELDDDVRRALDEVPPWPQPRWLIERTERQRYPMLWEAVRTTWTRDPADRPTLAQAVLAHTTDVLSNSFRAERGLEGRFGSIPPAPDVTVRSVQHDAVLVVDGIEHPAVRLDTDPFVFVVGAEIDEFTRVSAVVSRADMDYIRIQLAQR